MIARRVSEKCSRMTWFPRGGLGVGLALTAVLLLTLVAATASHAAPQACVPGPHSGIITADQEWCLSDGVHLVNGTVTVDGAAKLMVEPGVEIRFNSGTGLFVKGALIAEGWETKPITFTATTEGNY